MVPALIGIVLIIIFCIMKHFTPKPKSRNKHRLRSKHRCWNGDPELGILHKPLRLRGGMKPSTSKAENVSLYEYY